MAIYRWKFLQPQGAAVYNFVIRLALSMVADESKKIYTAISDGTINMVDKFFEMQRHDALKALDIYRRAGQQAETLSEFYEVCKSINIGHEETFLKIEQPPASFLTAMEEYAREAPHSLTLRKVEVKASPKVILAIEDKKSPLEQEASSPPPPSPPPLPPPLPPPSEVLKVEASPVVSKDPDLLDLYDANPDASELDAKNALALAIVPIDNPSVAAAPVSLTSENGTMGWELALITTPSSNDAAAASSKLAGGLDKLTLDSLYDDAIRRANQPTSYNPWDPALMAYDPFYASNTAAAPPHSVQMAAMAQHQQLFMLQQHQMMATMGRQQFNRLHPNAPENPYATINPQPHGFGMPRQSSNSYTGLI